MFSSRLRVGHARTRPSLQAMSAVSLVMFATTGAPVWAQSAASMPGTSTTTVPTATAAASSNVTTLAPVQVYGVDATSTSPTFGYTAPVSSTATKTDTPIIETPQSISVITQDQMREQGAYTLNQILRYTSGVAPETRGAAATRLDQFNVRGFSATTYLDGLRVYGSRDALPQVDSYRLERVDVLKGPASVLYGQGGPGGTVNLTSKRPLDTTQREVELQLGDFDYRRANFDFTGPMDEEGKLLYRLTGSGYMSDGQLDDTKERRYYIAPAFTWRPSAATSFTLLANIQRDPHMGSYGGVPALRSLRRAPDGIKLDPSFYDGDAGYETSDRRHHSVGYELSHKFNDTFTAKSSARFTHAEGIYRTVYTNSSGTGYRDPAALFLNRSKGGVNAQYDAIVTDNNLQARFGTGAVQHTVIAGLDLQHQNSRTKNSAFDAAPALDVLNPDHHMDISDPNWTTFAKQRQYQTGLYLQDQIKIDRLSLVLGGRYDWARSVSDTKTFETGAVRHSPTTRSEAFTGRAGAIYNFDNGFAPYVSYSESFEPQSGFDVNNEPLDPVEGKQYEIGVKYQPVGTTAIFTVAGFDIRRQNLTATAPGCAPQQPNCVVQTGEVRTRGMEFEARGEVAKGLSVIGNYSYIGNKYTKDNPNAQGVSRVGQRPYGVPKHQASVWTRYQLQEGTLQGLGLAAGVRYLGASADDSGVLKVPDATLVDAAIDYDLGRMNPQFKGMNVALNVTNLFDKEYVASCLSESWCWYGYQRSVRATLRYRW